MLQFVALRTHDVAGHRPETSWVHYTTSNNTQSSAPEDGRDNRPKHVELIGIINKPLLLHLVGVYIIYIKLYTVKQIPNLLKTCLTKNPVTRKLQQAQISHNRHCLRQSSPTRSRTANRCFATFTIHERIWQQVVVVYLKALS